MKEQQFIELNHFLAGSMAPATDVETGKPMKHTLQPGALFKVTEENTDRKQVEALWKSSSH